MQNIIYEHFRDFAQKTYLIEVEKNNCDLHCHRNFELIYLVEGDMVGEINGKKFTYEKDDMVFIPSYNSHIFKTPNYSKVIIFVIPYEYTTDFNAFFNHNTISDTLHDSAFNQTILPLLKMLISLNHLDNIGYAIKGIAIAVIGLILSHYETTPLNKNSNKYLIINALDYIEKNHDKPLSLQIISNKFQYNKDYFSKLFNKNVGMSLNDYINSIRVEHVLKMLSENEFSDILKIIFDCGFDSASTFYRSFKKLYNTSPNEYIKSLKQSNITSSN